MPAADHLDVVGLLQRGQFLLHPRQPFGRRVDRAGDAALGRRAGGPQRHQQVVQQHHRPAGGDAHDVSLGVNFPSFAGPDQHDVVLLGIDEDVVDALQAAKIAKGVGDRFLVLQRSRSRPLPGVAARSSAFRRLRSARRGSSPSPGFAACSGHPDRPVARCLARRRCRSRRRPPPVQQIVLSDDLSAHRQTN